LVPHFSVKAIQFPSFFPFSFFTKTRRPLVSIPKNYGLPLGFPGVAGLIGWRGEKITQLN